MAKPTKKVTLDRKYDKSVISEPDWDVVPTDEANRVHLKIDRLNYITYFFDTMKPRPIVVTYLTNELGWGPEEITRLKRSPAWAISQTVEKLLIMRAKGWDFNKDETNFVNKEFESFKNNPRFDLEPDTEPSGPPPIRNVHSHLIDAVDDLCDAWMDGEDATINLYVLFGKKPDTQKTLKERVRPYITGLLDDLLDLKAKDPQCTEGYDITVKQRNHRIKVLKDALQDIEKILMAGKTKNPRRKKIISAKKQMSSIKYLENSDEFKVRSIDPKKIVGAKRLYVFNVRYRTITEYVSTKIKGFSFKGTTLQDWDDKLSRTTTLRKPDLFIMHVLKRAPSGIDREWLKLTTKTAKTTGRINENCILLRVMDK